MGAALGTDAMFWMNLDAAYQLWKAGPADEAIERRARLREKFPVRDLVKRGWIEESRDPVELERRIFAYYRIQDEDEEPQLAYAAKRSNTSTGLTRVQQAWLFCVRQSRRRWTFGCTVKSFFAHVSMSSTR